VCSSAVDAWVMLVALVVGGGWSVVLMERLGLGRCARVRGCWLLRAVVIGDG
jgi:predicted membrane-bound spermidine synthase